jgi:hypothetical protein
MGQTYTRQSSFADGDTITAALFNNEYNQLVNAFSYSATNEATTGHRHDGSAGEGGNIPQIGDLDFLNKIVVDSTNNRWGFYVQVSTNTVEQIRLQDGVLLPVTDSDVDLGTTGLRFKDAYIDTVTTTGNVDVGGNLTVTGTTTFNGGTITMGDAATDNVVFGADVDSNIIPDDDDTYDLGSSTQEWRNLYIDGTANIDSLVADTADINGGTIDGTVIGGSSAAAITGTTITGTAITGTSFVIGSADISEAELEILDGATVTTDELNILDGVTATTAELNIMDGVTATTDELNILDGVTSTAAELNILDGVTSTATELNLLDGVTSTTAELNILDGVTASAADINLIDGITNGTVIASKAIITDVNKDITGGRNITISGELDAGSLDVSGNVDVDGTLETDALSINGTAVTSTAAELNILDGKAFLDEDNMASNSVTGIASQQSIKAYVDSQVTAQDLDLTDGTTSIAIDLDSEALSVLGGTGVTSTASGNGVTLAIDSTVTTLTGTQTLTNKTLTTPDVNTPDIDGGTIDGTVIGGATPAAGTFTTLTANTSITGTLATAAQPNITSVGTLTALTGGTGDLNWDSGTLFVDSSANKVGIGTSSPAVPLEIAATDQIGIRYTNSTATSTARLYLTAGTASGILQQYGNTHSTNANEFRIISTAGDVTIAPSSTEKVRVTTSGKVGIGTDSPDEILHVNAADSGNSLVAFTNSTTGLTTEFVVGINASEQAIIYNENNTDMIFATNDDEKMRIDTSGNVLVGTTNTAPATNNVEGIVLRNEGHINVSRAGGVVGYFNRKTDDGTILSFNKDGTGIGGIGVANTNNLFIGGTATDHAGIQFGTNTLIPETAGTQSNGLVDLGQSGGRFKDLYLSGTATATNMQVSNGGKYIFGGENTRITGETDGNGKIRLFTGGTEKVILDGSNVGIGTSSPESLVHIKAADSVTGVLKIEGGKNTVTSNGEINSQLDFGSNDNSVNNTGNIGGRIASVTEADNGAYTGMAFYTFTQDASPDLSEKLRITHNGKVGIGVTGPAQALDVSGNILSRGTSTEDRFIEIGTGRSGNGYSFLDLVGDATYTDYGLRIIRNNSGANTTSVIQHRGTGTLGLLTQEAAPIHFSTSNTERMRITDDSVGIGTSVFTNSYKTYIEGLDQDTANLTDSGNHGATLYLRATANAAGSGGAVAFGTTFGNKTPFAAIKGHVTDGATNTVGDLCFSTRASVSATALTERMRLTASGVIQSTNGTTTSEWYPSGGVQYFGTSTNHPIQFFTNNSNAVRIDASGNLLVGTTTFNNLSTESGMLASDSVVMARGALNDHQDACGVLQYLNNATWLRAYGDTTGSGYMVFKTGGGAGSSDTEAMRIDSVRNVLIGTTAVGVGTARHNVYNDSTNIASILVNQSGTANGTPIQRLYHYEANSTTSATMIQFLNRSVGQVGSITSTGSATAYNTSSDGRLKDITGSARGLEVINELNPVSYNWKSSGQADEGLIAQEVLDIVPNAVSGSEEDMYQMDYSKLVVHLVAGMKEQQTQIEALQSEINNLKGE